jgi:hypothetical protein
MAYPPDTKSCERPGCTNLCVRRPKEAPSTWSIRRFCGGACAAWRPPMNERPCARSGCSATLTREEGESYRDFAKRRYCGPDCFHIERRAVSPPKKCACEGCSTILHPRQDEGPSHFAGRRFCRIACANASKDRAPPPSPKPCQGPGCTKQVVPRPRDGQKGFARKKYCGNACKIAGQARDRAAGVRHVVGRPRPAAPRLRKSCRTARCSGEVVQKPNESRGKFDKRHYCSPACLKAFLREGANVERLKAARERSLAERWARADDRSGRATAQPSTRRKGSTQPSVTRMARAVGDAERAADRLRRHGPVWPMSTILSPHLPPSSNDKQWHVHGRVLSVEEMIAEAGIA